MKFQEIKFTVRGIGIFIGVIFAVCSAFYLINALFYLFMGIELIDILLGIF